MSRTKSIALDAWSVASILDKRKTQLRQVFKTGSPPDNPIPPRGAELELWYPGATVGTYVEHGNVCPDNQRPSWQVHTKTERRIIAVGRLEFWPGQSLWVKEPWCKDGGLVSYLADGDWIADFKNAEPVQFAHYGGRLKWQPASTMPQIHSRLTLLATDVRIQRLCDITEQDCSLEGHGCRITRDCKKPYFAEYWDAGNRRQDSKWAKDPIVYAITFVPQETKP